MLLHMLFDAMALCVRRLSLSDSYFRRFVMLSLAARRQ